MPAGLGRRIPQIAVLAFVWAKVTVKATAANGASRKATKRVAIKG